MLLSGLFGNETAEKALLYLANYGAGYPSGIAATFAIRLTPVQRQLERLEREGILASHLVGRTREYHWNPRYLFQKELGALLQRALACLPETYRARYFRERTRPRRQGKP